MDFPTVSRTYKHSHDAIKQKIHKKKFIMSKYSEALSHESLQMHLQADTNTLYLHNWNNFSIHVYYLY